MPIATPQVFNTTHLEKLSGIVKRITFHSPESGWTVLKITPFDRPGDEVPVTVYQSKVFAGATMTFYGNWTNHPKFGEQFKAVKVEELKPATTNALEKYLGSGLIKGVGPVFARRIVKHFGKDTLEVFDTDIERLMEVPGIAKKKLKTIVCAWEEHKDIKDVMLFLQSYDISTLFAVKIYKTYGKEAVRIVSENPYRLAKDIYGIGFFSADKVALSMGLGADSEQRIKAAIEHILAASREEGHCYLTTSQISKQVNELLGSMLDDRISPLLVSMEQAGDIKTRQLTPPQATIKDKTENVSTTATCYYAPSIYYDEEYIAKKVQQLSTNHLSVDTKRMDAWIAKYREKYKISLSDEQQQAVTRIAGCGFSILTGGPGCGKTTTTRVLVRLLNAMGRKVVLGAPTGRASQRMTEVIGLQAKTLHRLLEWQAAQGGFKKNEQEPLKTDFLIVDECSMLDVHLAAAVLRAVSPTTQVLFIGDADQLPSVGAGNVFKDLIAAESAPVFRLTKIFRQAKESSIIRFAHEINKGSVPKVESPFHIPSVWKQGIDCLFVDADEATQEQLKFIKRVKGNPEYAASSPSPTLHESNETTVEKRGMDHVTATDHTDEALYIDESLDTSLSSTAFTIPDKFQHVDIDQLLRTETGAEELREVLKNVHPWSSLQYGLTATDMVKRLYAKTIPNYLGEDVEIQVLSPMTRGSLGTFSLNKLLQEAVNPGGQGKAQLLLGERLFRVGDRVIQKRNNYDLEVFNGDIGVIVDIDNEEFKLTIEFKANGSTREVVYEKESLSELELAYAITIHKSQGSEFGAVIIPITTQHFNMLFRNLMYTGLTRAKKLAVFVGSRKALAMAVRNNKMLVRQTGLEELLGGG
jgi:exodeoxyribonuclease V alpha subunit